LCNKKNSNNTIKTTKIITITHIAICMVLESVEVVGDGDGFSGVSGCRKLENIASFKQTHGVEDSPVVEPMYIYPVSHACPTLHDVDDIYELASFVK
jgi:hypothetical protein